MVSLNPSKCLYPGGSTSVMLLLAYHLSCFSHRTVVCAKKKQQQKNPACSHMKTKTPSGSRGVSPKQTSITSHPVGTNILTYGLPSPCALFLKVCFSVVQGWLFAFPLRFRRFRVADCFLWKNVRYTSADWCAHNYMPSVPACSRAPGISERISVLMNLMMINRSVVCASLCVYRLVWKTPYGGTQQ